METTPVKQTNSIKSFFEQDSVKNRFQEMLGKKATPFLASIVQITANNTMLKNADPISIYNSALMAATLDLPINQNLGFAYIVPYGKVAQFMIGWRGIVQLAQRSGQYSAINVIEVYENQFESFNTLTEEIKADFSIPGDGKVVGYVAYFRLINGFEKTSFWTIDKVTKHGKKYSKSFNGSSSPWQSNFDEMAKKTVLKSTLSKWGILSIEMQTAVRVDQAVIKDEAGNEVEYIDHEEMKPDLKSKEEVEFETRIALINDSETIEDLSPFFDDNAPDEIKLAYNKRLEHLSVTK